MNQDLRDLLKQAGVSDAHAEDLWARAVMIHVRGLLPPIARSSTRAAEAGFHLLLLDQQGKVARRVKCRGSDDQGFRRECDALVALGSDPRASQFVLPVSTASSEHLRLHVSDYLGSESYADLIDDQNAPAWQETAEEILAIVHLLGERAKRAMPRLLPAREDVDLLSELGHRFAFLEEGRIEKATLDVLREVLRETSVPRHPQHGDLWPGNLIRGKDGRWLVIDFERFGEIQFPLYDAFHLIWSSMQGTRSSDLPATRSQAWHTACYNLLNGAADRHGLSGQQFGALALSFILEATAYRMRPGIPSSFSEDLRTILHRSAQRMEAGLDMSTLARECLFWT